MKSNSNFAVSRVFIVLVTALFSLASCSKDNVVPVGERNAKLVSATQLTDGNKTIPVGQYGTSPVKGAVLTADAAKSSIIPVGEHQTSPVIGTPVSVTPASAAHLIDDAVKGIIVNPNPTTGPITVQFTQQLVENYTIEVLDMKKTPLMTSSGTCNAGVNYVHLNLTSLGKGNYLLNFHSPEQNQTVEVSVQYP